MAASTASPASLAPGGYGGGAPTRIAPAALNLQAPGTGASEASRVRDFHGLPPMGAAHFTFERLWLGPAGIGGLPQYVAPCDLNLDGPCAMHDHGVAGNVCGRMCFLAAANLACVLCASCQSWAGGGGIFFGANPFAVAHQLCAILGYVVSAARVRRKGAGARRSVPRARARARVRVRRHVLPGLFSTRAARSYPPAFGSL